VVPQPVIMKETARIYDLQNPLAKMSKSSASDAGVVWMLDEPSKTAKKFKSAVTDDDRDIRFDRETKPGVSNLLTILSAFTGTAVTELEVSFDGKGYGDLKSTVADAVVATWEPMRARALELLDDPAELDRILGANADRAIAIAQPKLELAYDRIGLLRRP
jgi:tryptophanyl-tRNA synthetase